MTLQVQTEDNNENLLSKIETMQKCVKALMQTKHYQALGEPGIFALLQKAESLGMPQMEALNGGLYYVQGKVGMSTEAMASMIRSKGHSIIKDPKSNDNICILHGKRADNGDTWTCSFSIEDAKRAGLFKNVFEKYPTVMCYNRACSMLARQLFPDIIKGAGYTFDELKEIAESKNHVPVAQEKPAPIEVASIEKISQEQFEVLDDMIGEDTVYRSKVMKFLNDHLHISSLLDLPEHMFARVMNGAQKNNEEKAKLVKPLDIEEKETE